MQKLRVNLEKVKQQNLLVNPHRLTIGAGLGFSSLQGIMQLQKQLEDQFTINRESEKATVDKPLIHDLNNDDSLPKGSTNKNPLACKWYNANDEVLGKNMKTKKTSKSKGLETDPWLNEGRKAVTQRADEFLSILGQDLDAVSKAYVSVLKGFISQSHMLI
ncbi:hypothetical protein L1987_18644 [Smallanthus sonchifolius]|uniref:Uncharacterized protein n=1 Tax=Smallanthus sonchifolius TaxID=185202 RepID=A0ACB9J055_9ASTR|nr:hypothetical protein L1987_18644 [Smallanthus sonchifolius]